MMNDLWPDNILEVTYEKNDSLEILREQAKAISKKTSNRINATFSKINYSRPESVSALAKIGEVLVKVNQNTGHFEEELEPELKQKINANDLYKKVTYKFEIYNSSYRFRIFILEYSIEFPILLIVDEGIKEELNYSGDLQINSNQELEEALRQIFSSHKIQVILHRMLQVVEKEQKEQQIIEYIRDNPDVTTAQLASFMNLSRVVAKKYLDKMLIDGVLEKREENRSIKWRIINKEE